MSLKTIVLNNAWTQDQADAKKAAKQAAKDHKVGSLRHLRSIDPKWELHLYADRIAWKDEVHDWQSMPLTGLDATLPLIDTSSRVTGTRVLTLGLFALAAKKKEKLYALRITGPDDMVLEFPLDKSPSYAAKEMAKAINRTREQWYIEQTAQIERLKAEQE